MLGVPVDDPLIWLGAVVVGAIFGACAAVVVIIRYPRGTTGNDEVA
jgi:hypothetical protein